MTEPVEKNPGWLFGRWFWGLFALLAVALGVWLGVPYREHRRGEPGEFRVLTLECSSDGRPGAPHAVRVLVYDLRSGKPVAGERVEILGFPEPENGIPVGAGVTGSGGEWRAEVRLPDGDWRSMTLAAYLPRDGSPSGRTRQVWNQRSSPIAVTTDKPLYQPGQSVHARVLCFDGSRPRADSEITFTVVDPNGTKVFRETRKTSAFGIAHADFPLASEVRLGTYTLDVSGRDVAGRQPFLVKRYALPKGKVTLELEQKEYRPGETAHGTLSAVWSFGKPASGGRVRLFHDEVGGTPSAEGVTDARGRFGFSLRLPPSSSTLIALVEVEGGTILEGRAELRLRTATNRVEAVPENGVLVPDVENLVYLFTTRGGEPVRAKVSAAPGSAGVETDANGLGVLALRPLASQSSHEIVARFEDGTTATQTLSVLRPTEGEPGVLLVRAAKPALPAGGGAPIRVIVPKGNPGSVELALRRGEELLSTAHGTLDGEVAEVTLEIPKAARGLLLLSARSFGTRGYFGGGRYFIADGRGDLELRATFTDQRFAPGQRASLDLYASGPSGPTRVAFGLSAVDEAFFALSDLRPDLEKRLLTLDRELASLRERHYDSDGRRNSQSPSERISPEVPGALDADASDVARFAALGLLSERLAWRRWDGTWFDRSALPNVAAERADRLGGLATAWLGALGLLGMLSFVAFGAARIRRCPAPPESSAAERQRYRAGMRSLMISWLLAALLPAAATIAFLASVDALDALRTKELPVWAISGALYATPALVACGFQARALGTLASTEVARALPRTVRVSWLLPTGMALCQLALAACIATGFEWVRLVFTQRASVLACIACVAIAAELAFGVLSMLRQSAVAATSVGRRLWLVLSRATFVGLPVSVGVLGVLAAKLRHDNLDVYDFGGYESERFAERGGNREGGTGTRAKGEESSMGRRYGAQGPSDNPTGAPIRVRSFFPETLFWAPEVVSGADGHARIEIPLADSVTRYRVAVSAVSRQGELGSTTLPLVVFQDFFVDVTAPATLTQGDVVTLPLTVFNYLDEPQKVRLELDAKGFAVSGKPELELDLGAGETRGASLSVRALSAGSQLVRLTARGARRSDAVERKIDVVPDGVPVERVVSGAIDGATRASFELPSQAIAGGTSVALKIYGGAFSQLAEALDGAFHRPHGCFEQTSSTTYPNVLVLDFLRRSRTSSPALETKARAFIDDGYQKLVAFEVTGGGFDWFGRGPAHSVLSAYGLFEFHDMAKIRPIDEAMLERTRGFLWSTQRPDGSWAAPSHGVGSTGSVADDATGATAYIAWALAESGDADPRLARALDYVEHQKDSDPYALALSGLALAAGGRAGPASERVRALARAAVRGGGLAHWHSERRGLTQGYGQSLDVETTAFAAHLSARTGGDPALRREALAWLAAARDARGLWPSTSATVAALRALLDDALPVGTGQRKVTVKFNGEPVRELSLARGTLDVHQLVSLSERARPGENMVELEAAPGSDVSFQLVATHYLPRTSARSESPTPLALQVDYRAKSVAPSHTLDVETELGWSADRPSGMVLVEVGVPPGFEVVSEDLDALVSQGALLRHSESTRSAVLYLDRLERGQPKKLHFRLRGLFPVRALAPASTAYAYYEPEARAATRPVLLSVTP